MAVFTATTYETLAPWLSKNYGIALSGAPTPITEGIENTNYVINTDGGGKYVFTVIEVWNLEIASYCLSLATHLSAAGHPVPRTLANLEDGGTCSRYEGKPAAVVEFVSGSAKRDPSPQDCATIGGHLGRMHESVGEFALEVPNQRGFKWREAALPRIRDTLEGDDAKLLDDAVEVDRRLASESLAEGACHCDLFRGNVLWSGDDVAGIIDFYFSGHDRFIFDLSVTAVDWSMDDFGRLNAGNLNSLLRGYLGCRVLSNKERESFPDMMVSASLRFWLSRMDDVLNPRPSQELVAHDPSAFRHRLASCMERREEIVRALDDALA